MKSLIGRRRALILATAALAAVAVLAWAADFVAQRALNTDAYRVVVIYRDQELAQYSVDKLRKLDVRKVIMDGQLQEGPTLVSVLEDAGVGPFSRIRVIGAGVRDAGVYDFAKASLSEDVLLDFAVRGTVKLCAPDMKWADRVRDVERVEVW